jgi:hypothetical protein
LVPAWPFRETCSGLRRYQSLSEDFDRDRPDPELSLVVRSWSNACGSLKPALQLPMCRDSGQISRSEGFDRHQPYGPKRHARNPPGLPPKRNQRTFNNSEENIFGTQCSPSIDSDGFRSKAHQNKANGQSLLRTESAGRNYETAHGPRAPTHRILAHCATVPTMSGQLRSKWAFPKGSGVHPILDWLKSGPDAAARCMQTEFTCDIEILHYTFTGLPKGVLLRSHPYDRSRGPAILRAC